MKKTPTSNTPPLFSERELKRQAARGIVSIGDDLWLYSGGGVIRAKRPPLGAHPTNWDKWE